MTLDGNWKVHAEYPGARPASFPGTRPMRQTRQMDAEQLLNPLLVAARVE